MILLLFFAFLSGLLTILAPCIWPLLPIVLSSSTTGGGHRKPLGITLGVITSFSFFTLSVSYLVMLFHFDPNILRLIAAITIAFLGLTLIVPLLLIKYELLITKLSTLIGGQAVSVHHGFFGGFITGLSLGIVWSPCAGPILATIAALSATQSVSFEVILVTFAFAIGVGIPLFLFSLIGSFLFQRTKFISRYTDHLQKVFGVIMILTAFAIYTNYDKVIQAKLLNIFPSYSTTLTKLETTKAVKDQLDVLKKKKNTTQNMFNPSSLSDLGQAPEFNGITKWLNTEKPFTMQDLRGKVVLVDFWTYTCINCIRTLPYVTSWYDKYKDQGFVVIGVHTPEFEFEKTSSNVEAAIKQYNIHYPVPQDNNYATWNAFNNQYWPAEYLIDAKGTIRRTHFGEGEYDQTEMAIKELLKEKGVVVSKDLINMPDETPSSRLSPETYLGSKRMAYLYPNGSANNGKQTFTIAKNLYSGSFSFGGEWTVTEENSISGAKAVLAYNFNAQKVFLVIRPPAVTTAQVKVFLDNKPITKEMAGSDVKDGVVTVDRDRLYNLVNLKDGVGNHVLWLEFITPHTEVFAFTFG